MLHGQVHEIEGAALAESRHEVQSSVMPQRAGVRAANANAAAQVGERSAAGGALDLAGLSEAEARRLTAGFAPKLGGFDVIIRQLGDPNRLEDWKIELALLVINSQVKRPFGSVNAPQLRHNDPALTIFVATPTEIRTAMNAAPKDPFREWVVGSSKANVPNDPSFNSLERGSAYVPKEPEAARRSAFRINPANVHDVWVPTRSLELNAYNLALLIAHEATHTLVEVGDGAPIYQDASTTAVGLDGKPRGERFFSAEFLQHIQDRAAHYGIADDPRLLSLFTDAYKRPIMREGDANARYHVLLLGDHLAKVGFSRGRTSAMLHELTSWHLAHAGQDPARAQW